MQVAAHDPRRRRVEIAPIPEVPAQPEFALLQEIKPAAPRDEVQIPAPAQPEFTHLHEIDTAAPRDAMQASVPAQPTPAVPFVRPFRPIEALTVLNTVARSPSPDVDPGSPENINQIMNDLRETQFCTHERWRYIDGPHQCEECFYMLPRYVFECRHCRILACWRCRHNRL